MGHTRRNPSITKPDGLSGPGGERRDDQAFPVRTMSSIETRCVSAATQGRGSKASLLPHTHTHTGGNEDKGESREKAAIAGRSSTYKNAPFPLVQRPLNLGFKAHCAL